MNNIIEFWQNDLTKVIIIIFIVLIIFELFSVLKYILSAQFKLLKTVIKFLKINNSNSSIEKNNCDKDLFNWLSRYLDGEKSSRSIIVKRDINQDLVLSSYPSILTKPIPRSPVYFAPALLTALGILGTFWGIFFGLQKVGIDNIGTTQDLLSASTQLLSGMKTAFSTSLVGLGCASLMMIVLAICAFWRKKTRNSWRKKLNEIAYLESPQQLLSRLDTSSITNVANSMENVVDNLSSLNNLTPYNIASAIKDVIASEKETIVTELQTQNEYLYNQNLYLQTLTPKTIAQAIHPLLTPIEKELTQLREIQTEQQSTVQQLVKQLRDELIEPVVQRLDESAKLTEEASNAVKELKNELGGIAVSLAGAVKTIQEFQQNTLKELEVFAHSLQNILSQFRSDTQSVLKTVAVEINKAVNKSIEGMEAQREAFEVSANQASNTFKGIREDLQEALTTQAQQQKEMLEGVQTSTEKILEKANQVFENQSETLTRVGIEASQLLDRAKDNLLATLENIDEMLQKTRQTVQIELERFRLEYQTALQEFFEKQNNLLDETLGKQKDGLAEVVNDLQTTFKQEAEARKDLSADLDSSLKHIEETVKIVNNLVNATGMNSSERFAQLEELARTIGDEAKQVEDAYLKMDRKFEHILYQIVEEFDLLANETNKKINEYLELAGDVYSKSFEQADSAMANICDKLNQTSIGLSETSKYLIASVEELKASNHQS